MEMSQLHYLNFTIIGMGKEGFYLGYAKWFLYKWEGFNVEYAKWLLYKWNGFNVGYAKLMVSI